MLQSIGRPICTRQKKHIIEASKERACLFNIVKDVRYQKVVVVVAIRRVQDHLKLDLVGRH